MQNMHHPALAAWPRPMEDAQLAMRICEYTRETARVHLTQIPQKKLELPRRSPYKQQGVTLRPVLGSNP